MDSLMIGRIREDDGDKYITFNQTYKDIPVIGGEYVVSVLRNGNVQSILGSFYKNINIITNPNISTSGALEIIMKHHGNLKDSISSSRLVVFPKDNAYYLSWEMNIPNKNEEGVYTYYIDAKSGEILYKNDNVIYENTATLFSPQPEGNAYLHHPLIDQNYSYISPLDEINLSGYLQGSYANILNYATSRAYNSNRSFLYSPSNTHFDEANLYYHVTRFRKNFWNVVDNNFNAFSQITANSHYPFSSPNASYNPSTGQLYFSDASGFSGYNDFAKEDKVIYHEYTHAVTDHIAHLSNASDNGYNETYAIHEGNSDYFAGSFTGRTKINEYASQGVSINIRDMANPRIANYTQYNQTQSYIYGGINYGYHEPHFGGELWSASLWDLRKPATGISQYYADRLVYKALSAIPTNSNFLQYRQAIINKDNSTYSGTHVKKIEHVFYLRGIGTDSSGVTISGPSYLAFKERGYYTANVTGGSGQRTYQWYKSSNGGSSWSVMGTSQIQGYTMSTYDVDIKCTVHDTQTGENAYSPIKHVFYGYPPPKVAGTNNIPKKYSLSNYPNPFNPSTVVNYQLPKDGFVQLKIYDALGREIKTLVNGFKNAGNYDITFDAGNLPSGIYYYHLSVNDFSSTKKMLLLK